MRTLGLGLGLGGCGIYNVPRVETFDGAPARDALVRARDGNWRVRARAGTARPEGLVTFVTDSTVQIGGSRVRLAEIAEVDRWSYKDLGGRRAGAIVGGLAAVAFGTVVRSFWEWGDEGPCTLGCTLGIYVPSVVVMGLLGTVVGAVIQPPSGAWTPIWKRCWRDGRPARGGRPPSLRSGPPPGSIPSQESGE